MRPIETLYNGHRFRSRLEARWAVFFDALGVRYQYDLEAQDLPSGASYRPDFYLEELELYVEVGPLKRVPLADLKCIVEFAVDGDRPLLLIVGIPVQEKMFLIDRVHCSPADELEYQIEGDATEEEIVDILFDSFEDFASVRFGSSPRQRGWSLVYARIPPPDEARLEEALLKARSSFEFGESG